MLDFLLLIVKTLKQTIFLHNIQNKIIKNKKFTFRIRIRHNKKKCQKWRNIRRRRKIENLSHQDFFLLSEVT